MDSDVLKEDRREDVGCFLHYGIIRAKDPSSNLSRRVLIPIQSRMTLAQLFSKGEERQRGQFEMLHGEGDTNNGDRQ